MFLKELTTLPGVSGNEDAVRRFIVSRLQGRCDEVRVDRMGNVIAKRVGIVHRPVMLVAHMDEVGLIVTGVTDDGYLRFDTVGGIDPRVLVSKRVCVGERMIPGVIGYKAVHLQDADERGTAVKTKNLYIDIGADGRAEAEKNVSLGDYVSFDSPFELFGDDRIKAKALDNRAGCAILLDVMENARCGCDLYCVFTVQEEVGLRGAQVAAYDVRPELTIVLESTTCSDVYGTEERDWSTVLGGGVALSVVDRHTLYDPRLLRWAKKIAEWESIPIQYKQTATGGNEAGAIQRAGTGCPTLALNLPARYIHSPACVVSKKDYDHLHRLLYEMLDTLVRPTGPGLFDGPSTMRALHLYRKKKKAEREENIAAHPESKDGAEKKAGTETSDRTDCKTNADKKAKQEPNA